MTLTELRYIVAVARERHFGRAAQACFVSQPTLSVAVRKLESELGVPLFERGQKEVDITPLGEKIVAQAQQVLEQAALIKQIASAGKDQLIEPLHLGVIYTIGPYLLPRLLPLLHQRAPRMSLQIHENFTAELTEALRRGELDVIIISLPYAEPGVVTETLYTEPFVLALPVDHPWAGRAAIPVDELVDQTVLLLGAGNCFRDQVLAACPGCNAGRPAAGTIQKTLEGSSLETVRQMVASGAGVTVLPCTSSGGTGELQGLLITRPFAEPTPHREVAIAYRKSFPRAEAIAVLRQAILDCPLPCVEKVATPPIAT